MVIVMQKKAGVEEVARVVGVIRSRGLTEHISQDSERTAIGAVGDGRVFRSNELDNLPGVECVICTLNDWQITSREVQSEDSVTHVRGVASGGSRMLGITVDEQFVGCVDAVYVDLFYLFTRAYTGWNTGKGRAQETDMKDSLQRLHEADKPVLVRIRDARQTETALAVEADILYLGGELMDNRALQDGVDCLNTSVMLCKDRHHRADGWLVVTEHIAQCGNRHVILGEAGTLSFKPKYTRRPDIDAIVRVWCASHPPVTVNTTRLWHNDMLQDVLYKLAAAVGANGAVSSLK